MDQLSIIRAEFEQASQVLSHFLSDEKNLQSIFKAANLMADVIKSGGKVISCGNGGSLCDAMHFAEELSGRFRNDRNSLPAIAISDPSYITCVGNDYGFDFVFSRFVEGIGCEGDVLLAISTSGNSTNVINAAIAAKAKGMRVVTMTGKGGGKLGAHADISIDVAHFGFADRIQEVHIKVIHALILLIEKETA